MAVHYTTTTTFPTMVTAVSHFNFRKTQEFSCRMPTCQRSPHGLTACHQDKTPEAATPLAGISDGNRIVSFMQEKSYFVTGATGFLAKVFIEKLLRAAPETGKIFLLMKAKDQEAAKKRLYDEIINSDLFELLRQTHGHSYEGFMTSKLIPVVGDISVNNLGMDSETANKIAKEIDVIISSASRTTFDDRFDLALSINTLGPDQLMRFTKKCEKLNLFLHFSTAYVNGMRQGIVPETPLGRLKIESEVELASEAIRSFRHGELTRKMKELGHERAKTHGYQDTYTFTKAMGEMVIESSRGNLPVVIIRPSAIESSYKEPFPGWIQGNRMVDPFLLAYGKGQLPGFFGDPQAVVDFVPVDMVVNTAMAAMAKHAVDAKPGLNVYHATSSALNPLLIYQLSDIARQYFSCSPLRDSKGEDIMIQPAAFHLSLEDFSSCTSNIMTEQDRKKDGKLCKTSKMKRERKVKYIMGMAKAYEPIAFTKAQFDNTNTQKLMEDMTNRRERNVWVKHRTHRLGALLPGCTSSRSEEACHAGKTEMKEYGTNYTKEIEIPIHLSNSGTNSCNCSMICP